MSKKKRHGHRPVAASAKPRKQSIEFVARPFVGLSAERNLVAVAQIIPTAVAAVRLIKKYGGKQIQLVVLPPGFVRGLKHSDGEVLVTIQVSMHSRDASRNVAAVVLAILELSKGQALRTDGLPEPGPRLQDILDTIEPLVVSVRETFDFWTDPQTTGNNKQARQVIEEVIERAEEEIVLTRPVFGVEHAYWCQLGTKEFVRQVRGKDEDESLNVFARTYAVCESDLEEGARFTGALRANDLVIPVWELVSGTGAEELTKPSRVTNKRLEAALADSSPLSPEVHYIRAGIISRRVNLRLCFLVEPSISYVALRSFCGALRRMPDSALTGTGDSSYWPDRPSLMGTPHAPGDTLFWPGTSCVCGDGDPIPDSIEYPRLERHISGHAERPRRCWRQGGQVR